MNFGNPFFLYTLPVVLVPVIIHFLKLYRTTTFYYSRVEDIKRLKKDQKKVKQLRDWLTLLLRTLAILFLILAFAKPTFNASHETNPNSTSALHLIIDNSPSNSLLGDKGFSAYKTAAIDLLENLPENQEISLSNTNNFWENILINDAIQRISSMELSNERFEPSTISDTVSTKYIFSDFQSYEWSNTVGSKAYFFSSELIQQNLAIDTAYVLSNYGRGQDQKIVVEFSRSALGNEKNAFQLSVNKDVILNKIINFGGSLSFSDTLNITLDTMLYSQIMLEIDDPNGLLFDNAYRLSLPPRKKIRVAVYGTQKESKTFEKLLGKDGDYQYEYLKQGKDNFTNTEYDKLLIVEGVNHIDANLLAELQSLQQKGGACLFFPGKEIDRTVAEFLQAFQVELKKQKSEGNQLQSFQFQHPFFNNVFSQIPNNPSLPLVTDGFVIEGTASYNELIKGVYGSLAVLLKKQNFQLVLTGIPYEENGTGNTFFKHALFVPFSLKALEQYAPQNQLNSIINGRLYSKTQKNGTALIVNKEDVLAELPWQKQFGKSYLNLEGISLKAGFYSIQTGDETELIAVNSPRSESIIQFESDEALISNGYTKVDSIEDAGQFDLLDFEKNDSYLFFAFVFICLLLESLINKFLGHESKGIQGS